MLNLVWIETEELRGLVCNSLLFLVEGNDMAHLLDILPEIPFVKLFFQDRFVQLLELTECEFFGEQFEADVVALELCLQRLNGTGQNGVVVEGEGPNIADVNPIDTTSKRGGLWVVVVQTDEAKVANRDDALVGLGPNCPQPRTVFMILHTIRVSVRMKLFEVDAFDLGQFIQYAFCRFMEPFIQQDQVAGQLGHGLARSIAVGIFFLVDQQHLETVVIVPE